MKRTTVGVKRNGIPGPAQFTFWSRISLINSPSRHYIVSY
jgi:hypothetical protein